MARTEYNFFFRKVAHQFFRIEENMTHPYGVYNFFYFSSTEVLVMAITLLFI